ncbi:LuxR C-terminal-related transcriptional regulator [uncultured Draconibacterium sp.]|uniref:LuxR C-terminal-related transcriptional regulator n=1 Tax=uncultured Draconibacterium sp. TaxID=1573823 RepID=UPI0025DBF35C|nr:LuxR C-terminal-related transcriptional regulator [uncultured Draconibacterium sp.]
MQNEHVANILSVWEEGNTIQQPSKKKMALEIVEQISSTFAAGTFYYYLLNFETLEMEYVDPSIKNVLGIEANEFSLDTLFSSMHPEDLAVMHTKEQEAVDFLFNKISVEELPLYKVVYLMRLKHTSGLYKTILHQAQTVNVSIDGKVQQVIGVHTDISHLPIPFDHKISFISNTRPSYYSVIPDISMELLQDSFGLLFTPKEKQILKELAEGKNYKQLAESLGVSPHTINTHKRNILNKSHSATITELIAKCIRAGII